MTDSGYKQVAGTFESANNLLHLWFPRVVTLSEAAEVKRFFDEVTADWVDPTPGRFYLLVNYANLHISARVASAYAESIRGFQHRLLGTFRYGLPGGFTGVAVSLGNGQLRAQANLYDDEAAARAAIAEHATGSLATPREVSAQS